MKTLDGFDIGYMELIELPRDWILAIWVGETIAWDNELSDWVDKPAWYSGLEHPTKGVIPNKPFQKDLGPFETKEEAVKATRIYWEKRFGIPLNDPDSI